MALSEQQLGRLAAFIAELGEHPTEETWHDAKQALQQQTPELFQSIFGDGFQRGEAKAEKRFKPELERLRAQRPPGLSADQELAVHQREAELRGRLDGLTAQVETERRDRVRAEVERAGA
jgi:hypothetical protein